MKILGEKKHFRQREEQAPMFKGRRKVSVFERQKMKAGNLQNMHSPAGGH